MLPITTREMNLLNQEIGEYLPGKELADLTGQSEATVSRSKYNGGGPIAGAINILNGLERERLFASQHEPDEARRIDDLMGRICAVIALPASRRVYRQRLVHSVTPDAIQAISQTSRDFAEMIDRVTDAFAADGDGGSRITPAEFAQIAKEADDLVECCQLIKAVCERCMETGHER